jgi:hypothetical protein
MVANYQGRKHQGRVRLAKSYETSPSNATSAAALSAYVLGGSHHSQSGWGFCPFGAPSMTAATRSQLQASSEECPAHPGSSSHHVDQGRLVVDLK